MATIDYTANQITRMIRNAVVAQETVGIYAINKYMVPNYSSPTDKTIGDASTFQGNPKTGLVCVEPKENAPRGELIEDWYNSTVYSVRRVPGVEPDYDPIVPFSLGKYKGMENPVLLSGTDGVGTKLSVTKESKEKVDVSPELFNDNPQVKRFVQYGIKGSAPSYYLRDGLDRLFD